MAFTTHGSMYLSEKVSLPYGKDRAQGFGSLKLSER